MATVHDFATSKNSDDAPWWADVYRRAFPSYVTHDLVSDVELQKAGIDHRIHLSGGGLVLVDAKVRDKWYDDILIEVYSDRQRKRPGWVLKSLHCHYVAYAFPVSEVAFLLPFHLLQLAYQRNKEEWAAFAHSEADGFRVVDALNSDANGGSYTTRSVAVPYKRLCEEVASAMTVYFSEEGRPF